MDHTPDLQWRIKDLEREVARLRDEFERAQRRRLAGPSVDERLLQLLCIVLLVGSFTWLVIRAASGAG